MKNLKKLSISLLTTAIILGGTNLAINADEDSKSLTVTYELDEGYEWSIPDDIEFEDTSTNKYGEVSVSNVHLEPGHSLKILFANTNGVYMGNKLDSGVTSTNYYIGKAADLTVASNRFGIGGQILLIPSDYTSSTPMKVDVYARLNEIPQKAGTYETAAKFIATIVSST